jgi:hypothetical protein
LRGTKGRVYDDIMFTFENQNDFAVLEVYAFLDAYQEAFKPVKNDLQFILIIIHDGIINNTNYILNNKLS